MTPNAFINHVGEPTDQEVAGALGAKMNKLWVRLLSELTEEYGLAREWNSYSPKAGWALRLKKAKRNIIYFSPCEKSFRVSFVLGEKAVKAARESELPAEMVEQIEQSKKYPEGRGVVIEFPGATDLEVVKKLVVVKMKN